MPEVPVPSVPGQAARESAADSSRPSVTAACVDAIIADPPYSSGGMYRSDRNQLTSAKYGSYDSKTQRPEFTGDNRDQRSFGYWSALWLGECQRVAKPGAPVCIFCDWRQLATVSDVVQAAGFIWRGVCVWDKTEACRKTLGRFAAQAEYIVWGSNGPMPYERKVKCLPGVFRVPVKPRDKFHIAGKPTELMLRVVEICEPGGLVLDPFCGSATTGVAALRRGLRFAGIERDRVYARIGRQRLAAEEVGGPCRAQGAGQMDLFG